MGTKLYAGYIKGQLPLEVFRSPAEPTSESHGERYAAVIGPFRTRRAADWMAHPVRGRFNPHCRTVADAERLAKRYENEYDPKTRSWSEPLPPAA
jgi:hypothetical protein